MPKRSTIEIVETDLFEHPAVRAWSQLGPDRVEPDRISVLQKVKKSQVYRLEGVGLEGASVIAKRCKQRTALREQKIYGEILPRLPVSSLRYYGLVEEPDATFCWVFLEDAGGEPYSLGLEEHRTLAAQWLGALHMSVAAADATADFRHVGSTHYLEQLQTARDEIRNGLSNPVFTPENLDLLRTMISQLTLLERHWNGVAEFCDRMPQTLIHGDLVVKNVRVRNHAKQKTLLVMDWEFVGWGVPAIDLTQSGWGSKSLGPDLATYRSAMQPRWPHLSAEDVAQLAHVGGIFRLISVIAWASHSLSSRWVEDDLMELQIYEERLRTFIESAGLR